MTDRQDMEAVLEAVLFVANEPVPKEKILEVFDEGERVLAAEALAAVCERYQESTGRGIVLDEAGGGLRLVTRPDLHGYLRRFFEVSGSNKLSMAALETLAIIAYRQPITGPEIQELRGVSPSGVLKKLLERRLVRVAGRKEVVGKPFLYATTRDFLMHFGLRSLKELPPLEQFEELFGGEEDGGQAPAGPDTEEQVLLEVAAIEEAQEAAEDRAEADRAAAELVAEEEAEGVVEAEAAAAEPASEETEDATEVEQLAAKPETVEIEDTTEADQAAAQAADGVQFEEAAEANHAAEPNTEEAGEADESARTVPEVAAPSSAEDRSEEPEASDPEASDSEESSLDEQLVAVDEEDLEEVALS